MAEAKKKAVIKEKASKQKLDESVILEEKEHTNGDIQEDSQSSSQESSAAVEIDSAVIPSDLSAVASAQEEAEESRDEDEISPQGRDDKSTAKSGKRSAKALEEAEAKEAKEARKAEAADSDDKPKKAVKPARSKLERRGKKFREAAKLVEKDKVYTLSEAVALAVKTSAVKFDATVELHINLNVDPKHADQNVRDNLVLPAGTGKEVRIAVFADTDDAAAAKKAGADIAGVEDVLKLLDKGQLDFDVLIATPSQMAKLGKYARTLGPKGLMPNPKSGTVTPDVAKAVKDAKAGRVEYRVDSTGIVHLGVGKVSFGDDKLLENIQAVIASIKGNKPASVKSNYIKVAHLTTSMGPSITTLLE